MRRETVLLVTDFGARPDGADCTKAVQEALEAAGRISGPKTLVFPKGVYHFYKDFARQRPYHTSNTDSGKNPVKTIALLIEGQEDLTVEGEGSLLMLHGNMMALAVVRSRQVRLHDFSWDFGVPTTSEMEVAGIGEDAQGQYTDFHIAPCFPFEIAGDGRTLLWTSEKSPHTGEYYWTEKNGHRAWSAVAYDPETKVCRRYANADGPFHDAQSIQKNGEGGVRITYRKRPSAHKQGLVFELCSSSERETAGAFVWESSDVSCERVNIHYMHGFGFLTQMSHNVSFLSCRFMPRAGSGKYTTSYADLIHVSGASGEIRIEGCAFGFAHDDPINIHGTFTRVVKKLAPDALQLEYVHNQQGGFPQYHVGDEVAFYHRGSLQPPPGGERLYRVTRVANAGEEGNGLKSMTVVFDRPLPAGIAGRLGISGGFQHKYVAENVTFTPAVTIRNNTFESIPTRGILCTTRRRVLIEGNTFTNMAMASIFLSNDSSDWYESGPIRDLTIRGNTFYIRPTGQTEWGDAPALYVHPVTKGKGLPPASEPVHRNITFEGNTVYLAHDRVAVAECVQGLTIRGNHVIREESGEPVRDLYRFVNCSDVLVEGNTYGEGLEMNAVMSGMEKQALVMRDPVAVKAE